MDNTQKENLDMVLSQVKSAQHHADELSQIVKSKPNIEAWVVAKMQRASTDLSDVTHYLDGLKMKQGGNITKSYIEKEMDIVNSELYHVKSQLENSNLSEADKLMLKSRFNLLTDKKERLEMRSNFNSQVFPSNASFKKYSNGGNILIRNKAVNFGKKAIKAKMEDKVRIAKMAIQKWPTSGYESQLTNAEEILKSGKLPSWETPHKPQGDDKQANYDIFMGNNAVVLAKEIAKVIKKYKKYEVEQSSTGAAAGWSGTMRSTIGGDIIGRANFNPGGRRRYLIAVTVGSGIDSSVKNKMFQELYELFFVFDQYNSSDGGVAFNTESGSNYSTIGLTNELYSFNTVTAENLKKIMND